MSITYRQHQDTRDGKIYNCVLMPDGKWWSAENLAWTGAGYDYNNDPSLRSLWGRYYDFGDYTPNPTLASLLPKGTHCPSVAEWWALVDACGETRFTEYVEQFTTARMRTANLWKPYPYDEAPFTPGLDLFGFSLVPSGRGSYGPSWSDIEKVAIYWTSDAQSSYSNYFCEITPMSGVLNSYRATNNPISIRFIIDAFNEPIPPTKIKGTFSGSGVKVFCSNYNTPTFELPLSAQTTTELTINKDFIATWGVVLGNVRILVVDGEYISDWKDWNFNA